MKLNTKALAFASGLLWGGAVLMVGIGNMISPDYGSAFLSLAASVYPGYTPFTGVGSVITGAIYGLVDGAIAGLIFGWIYNAFAK